MPGHTQNGGVLPPWLTPMRAACGPLRNIGFAGSLIVHLIGLSFFSTVIAVFDQLFWDGEFIEDIVDNFRGDPLIGMLGTGLTMLGYELLILLLAWMTTCWGAGVEPFRMSFSRSLSRWYQLTPWIALIILGLIAAIQGIEQIEDWYWDNYDYARYGDYYDDHTQPMRLITHDRFRLLLDIGRFGSLGIANLLALWWVLGTLMVHRSKPTWFASCRWPAVCEGCGYALAGLTDEQTCPECGKGVGESTHADRGHRAIKSLRMLMRGLFKPSAVGAAMVTRQPTKQPLRVLLWGLFFTVLAGPTLIVMVDIGDRISSPGGYSMLDNFGDILEYVVMVGLTVGIYAALIGSFILLGAGTLVGTIVRVMGKRNIMPAACFAACYSAALLPAWVLAQGLQLLILIPLAHYLDDVGRYKLISFFPFLVLAFHAFMLLYMVFHIARITKAARYANV